MARGAHGAAPAPPPAETHRRRRAIPVGQPPRRRWVPHHRRRRGQAGTLMQCSRASAAPPSPVLCGRHWHLSLSVVRFPLCSKNLSTTTSRMKCRVSSAAPALFSVCSARAVRFEGTGWHHVVVDKILRLSLPFFACCCDVQNISQEKPRHLGAAAAASGASCRWDRRKSGCGSRARWRCCGLEGEGRWYVLPRLQASLQIVMLPPPHCCAVAGGPHRGHLTNGVVPFCSPHCFRRRS